jgi:cytochrome P450
MGSRIHLVTLLFGPRSCVGRNLASMELAIIISSILRRFDFVLEDPKQPVRRYGSRCQF